MVPLEAKASKLVAIELVHVFRQYGAYGPPAILQSDNGTEFTASACVGLDGETETTRGGLQETTSGGLRPFR